MWLATGDCRLVKGMLQYIATVFRDTKVSVYYVNPFFLSTSSTNDYTWTSEVACIVALSYELSKLTLQLYADELKHNKGQLG